MTEPAQDLRIYIGHSPNEALASYVAEFSLHATADLGVDQRLRVQPISRHTLYHAYTRPTEIRRLPSGDSQLYDVISEAPMSTDHAIARFFIPWLCDYKGYALFTDGDILCRRTITELFDAADPRHAISCVQHPPQIVEATKKGGMVQQAYSKKNWSSVLLFNCAHPANRELTVAVCNSWPGRDLHAFKWLRDESLIGALDPAWNYLVNVSEPLADPAIVHFTEGLPTLADHAQDPFADEWMEIARGRRIGAAVDARDAAERGLPWDMETRS